ncbi:MAG TPA: glycosyltransferase family 39 protein, partial [Polyangiaceae bacterium]
MSWVERRKHLLRYLPHAVLALVLVVGLATVGDYGITIDEPVRARSGDSWWHFLATWDSRYLPHGFFANYGALFDMLGSAVARGHRAIGGDDVYFARHLLIFVSGWLGLLGTYLLGRRVLTPAGAVMALVILVLMPRYYGPCFNNPKDIPFAATFVWAMFGLVRLLQDPSPRSAVLCGALGALCTAVRPFGAVFAPLGALACLWPLAEAARERRWRLLAFQLSSAIVLTVALWPILWVRPPWHVVKAMLVLGSDLNPEGTPLPHLFLGKVYSPLESPPYYLPVWLAVTLPVPTLALVLAGGAFLLARVRRAERRAALWTAAILGIWVLAPIAIPFVHRVALYDGIRHFLFVVPAICLLAALGWQHVFALARQPWQRTALAGVAALLYGDVALTEARLHPYEDLYFSRLIGGLGGASGSFGVAYWGATYRESFEWLEHHADPPVYVSSFFLDVPAYYAGRMGMALDPEKFGFFLTEVRVNQTDYMPGEVVHTISREGVPLAVVVKIAPMEQPASAW